MIAPFDAGQALRDDRALTGDDSGDDGSGATDVRQYVIEWRPSGGTSPEMT